MQSYLKDPSNLGDIAISNIQMVKLTPPPGTTLFSFFVHK